MDMIKELFYGNIHPFERDAPKDSEGFINDQRLSISRQADGRIALRRRIITARQRVVRCRAILLLIVLILSAKNIAKGWHNEEETPCIAVFCPVCDLLEKGDSYPLKSFVRC